jgi:hypothetical protein
MGSIAALGRVRLKARTPRWEDGVARIFHFSVIGRLTFAVGWAYKAFIDGVAAGHWRRTLTCLHLNLLGFGPVR